MVDSDNPDSQICVIVLEKPKSMTIIFRWVCLFVFLLFSDDILSKSVSILSQGASRKWNVEILPMSEAILGNILASLCVLVPGLWIANITGNNVWFPRKLIQSEHTFLMQHFLLIFSVKCFTSCAIATASPWDSLSNFKCFNQCTYRLVWARKLNKIMIQKNMNNKLKQENFSEKKKKN